MLTEEKGYVVYSSLGMSRVTCHVSSGNGGRHGYVGDDGGDDGCGEMTNRRRDPYCFSSLTLI